MVEKIKKEEQVELRDLRQYYSAILNSMPYLVYWIDEHCVLQGCNAHFTALLDLKHINDFSGSPYNKLAKATKWPVEDIEAFRLDDMSVIFSGQAKYERALPPIVNADGQVSYFICNRDPLFDPAGRVIGAVVVMVEVTEQHLQNQRAAYVQAALDANPSLRDSTRVPRVLIVEDNAIAKKVEEALLLAQNCEVDSAESGQQALSLFQPGKYDLVMMDIGLEDTSGYVLSKQFRQLEKDTKFHVPIIALTSFKADLVKYDCDYYFMDGVLSKPLTAEQADQIVQHYVHHRNTTVNGLKHA